jgi:hypothetical protein
MRKLVVTVLAVAVTVGVWTVAGPMPARGGPGAPFVFPLKINGTSWQTGVVGVPGKKLGVRKIKDENVTRVLTGQLLDFASNLVPLDPAGRFYVFYDGRQSWRIGTNPTGTGAVPFHGRVANDGTFWMRATYAVPVLGGTAEFLCTGKVKFESGTFDPKKISGVCFAVSESATTGLTVKIKTLNRI